MKNTILRETREKRGLTQVQVADQAGITEVCYQRYEYGKTNRAVRTAILIARALGSTVEDLFGAATPGETGGK